MERVNQWHKTRTGYLVFGLAELTLAYIFGSLAINSAHFWQYLLAVVFLIGGLKNLVNIFRTKT